MDFTMLRQMSRRANVEAAFLDDEEFKPLGSILNPHPISINTPSKPLSGIEQAQYIAGGSTELSEEDYNMLLQYLHATGRPYHSVKEHIIGRRNVRFLPPYVQIHTEVLVDERTFSTRISHEGNSAVQFIHPTTQQLDTGFIEAIFSTPLDSTIHTFFVIRSHLRLALQEEGQAPFASFHEKYATRIVDCRDLDQLQYVEQQHIITHLATYRRPAGTYGIPRQTLVVCWALNRGRR